MSFYPSRGMHRCAFFYCSLSSDIVARNLSANPIRWLVADLLSPSLSHQPNAIGITKSIHHSFVRSSVDPFIRGACVSNVDPWCSRYRMEWICNGSPTTSKPMAMLCSSGDVTTDSVNRNSKRSWQSGGRQLRGAPPACGRPPAAMMF